MFSVPKKCNYTFIKYAHVILLVVPWIISIVGVFLFKGINIVKCIISFYLYVTMSPHVFKL